MPAVKTREASAPNRPTSEKEAKKKEAKNPQATRETVESIVVAVVLAFLFRAFIAEAFVIPTGSMAPTLQGRHMDVRCKQCGFQYRTGASGENPDSTSQREVTDTTCPMCRYTMKLRKDENPNHRSFNGDRILVSKFAYWLNDPERWDVIVFKYPGNAKQNYIKRLIGLPGERITIRHGDVWVGKTTDAGDADGGAQASIARKPPDKVSAMLQLVHDTNYVGKDLEDVGWPVRWQPASEADGNRGWRFEGAREGWVCDGGPQDTWLRYRHLVPWAEDWADIRRGRLPARLDRFQGQLITDYYEYNDNGPSSWIDAKKVNWVGDLAIECDVQIEGTEGELLLDLVEGGTHFTCRIDVASGRAGLSMNGSPGAFSDDRGRQVKEPKAETALRGPGRYRLRFANVDDQLHLWVNRRLVVFDSPATFESPPNVAPKWDSRDPGDLAPLGIGSRGAAVRVSRLRVLRDVYYIAVDPQYGESEYEPWLSEAEILRTMSTPQLWAKTSLFERRRSATFTLAADQFFPMGDNSPQSKDARLWSQWDGEEGGFYPPPYVARQMLIGKALLIYWPHAWRGPFRLPFDLPLLPNFARMGLIR